MRLYWGGLVGAGVFVVTLIVLIGIVLALFYNTLDFGDNFLSIGLFFLAQAGAIVLAYRVAARTTGAIRYQLGIEGTSDPLLFTTRRWTARSWAAGMGTFVLIAGVLGTIAMTILFSIFSSSYVDLLPGMILITLSLCLPVIFGYRMGLRAADRVMGKAAQPSYPERSADQAAPAVAGSIISNRNTAALLAGGLVFLVSLALLTGVIAAISDTTSLSWWDKDSAFYYPLFISLSLSIFLAYNLAGRTVRRETVRAGQEKDAGHLPIPVKKQTPASLAADGVLFILIAVIPGIYIQELFFEYFSNNGMDVFPGIFLITGVLCLPVILGQDLGSRAAAKVLADNERAKTLVATAPAVPGKEAAATAARQAAPALPAHTPQWARWTANGAGLLVGAGLVLVGVLLLGGIGLLLFIGITDSIYNTSISILVTLALIGGFIAAVVMLFRFGIRLGNWVRFTLGRSLSGQPAVQPQPNPEEKMQA